MRAGIIADDLTGACDSAARAAGAGWRPRVLLNGARAGLDLSVISTASRGLCAEKAAQAARDAAREFLDRGVRPLYKKIDSTLRGPWAAEVAAVARATAAELTAVCPAFPDCDRTVRDGVVYCGGSALGELRAPLEAAGIAGSSIVIGNAETNEELAGFVQSVAERGRTVLWVGSGGLARYAFGRRDQFAVPFPVAERWLVVAGSSHPATLAQVEVARAAGIEVAAGPEPAVSDFAGLGLFLIGGDTAERVVRGLKAVALDVIGEPLPGIAAGRIVGGLADGAPFLTKAGAFGGRDSIVAAIRQMK